MRSMNKSKVSACTVHEELHGVKLGLLIEVQVT